jgi:hypothetical protein
VIKHGRKGFVQTNLRFAFSLAETQETTFAAHAALKRAADS